jgi:hypothetical protein
MSDEIDPDLLGELTAPEGLGDGDLEAVPSADPDGRSSATASGPGPRSRLVGLIALLLGVIGSVLMVVVAAVVIRFGFGASDTVERVMTPVEVSFDRMEARIDQTDDLVDREAIAPDRVDELQARVDGLVDVATGARDLFESVEDHPVYGLLPAELSTLGDALADFESSATTIDSQLGSAENGDRISTAVSGAVADELDGLQSRVTGVRETISDAANSLRRWIRLGSLLGFLGSLWGLWGQVSLARRGWRGFRGR